MPTLDEILNNNLGLADQGQEKTASVETPESTDDGINKLAAELGLLGEEEVNATAKPDGHVKEAQMNDLQDIYTELYPDDANIFAGEGQEKTAAMNKEAEAEEAMGIVAHDSFLETVDMHITKIANQMMDVEGTSGEAHPQKFDSNENTTEAAIDTTPTHAEGEKAMSTSPEAPVGNFEKKKAPMGQLKAAALRKHLLGSIIDEE